MMKVTTRKGLEEERWKELPCEDRVWVGPTDRSLRRIVSPSVLRFCRDLQLAGRQRLSGPVFSVVKTCGFGIVRTAEVVRRVVYALSS